MKPISKIGAILALIALIIALDYLLVRMRYRNLVEKQAAIIEENRDTIAREEAEIDALRNRLLECQEENQTLTWSNSEFKERLNDKEMALQDLSDTFSQELNIYEAEFAELSKKDSEATRMIENLNQALEQNESRSKILKKIENLEAEKETLEEEYSGKLSNLKAIKNRLVDLQTECERFKSTDPGKKYTNIRSEFCIDAARAEKEIQGLQDEIDFLRSLIEANENQIENYQNAL